MPLGRALASKRSKLCIAGILGNALIAAPALCSNRDALRQIVQEQCVAHWVQQHNPAPCERVYLADPVREDSGYAVLADRKGGAHFLLIPTRRIAGIESPELIEPGAPNYFSSAWQARDRLAAAVGHEVPRNAVGLAVNPMHARSQDQLHIHIECLRPDVFEALNRDGDRIAATWTPVSIGGAGYSALKIMGEDLGDDNPFKLLTDVIPQAHRVMGDYTLVVAGMQSKSGPGFIVLAGTSVAGELLLDSTCAVARAS
jgi:CDP-diacylglycerol pyrophosphatase